EAEAVAEARLMLEVYADFAENYMALPVIKGVKSESERFAGAVDTYCIEALMQDGKALQAGTSHFLGQNFAKAFDVKFSDKNNQLEYVWATSWGVSTRLIGALIMAHSDDEGLILPPKIAPLQVVIVPIFKGDEQLQQIKAAVLPIMQNLKSQGISVKLDDNEQNRPGWKFAEYEMKGVPVRMAIGARDLANQVVEIARRDTKEKTTVSLTGIEDYIKNLLQDIQSNLYNRALQFRDQHITPANSWQEFTELLDGKGGFVSAHWDGTAQTEDAIKELTKATIRCIPLNALQEDGVCIHSGKPSTQRVLFARAY
ncbi:MAG: proline--tRNA ligase, partial [Bacteroidetes bacterium]